jgi:hypothetical protein
MGFSDSGMSSHNKVTSTQNDNVLITIAAIKKELAGINDAVFKDI